MKFKEVIELFQIRRPTLTKYIKEKFDDVNVVVIREDKVLLKQSYSNKNSKTLLSLYVEMNEAIEEAIMRAIKEKLGIEIEDVKYLGSDFVNEKEVSILIYMAIYKCGEISEFSETELISWVNFEHVLDQMKEDEVGQKAIKKVLKELKLDWVYGFKTISNSLEI